MRVRACQLPIFIVAFATPSPAVVPAKVRIDAAKFDAAVDAGHATILSLSGRTPVIKTFTAACITHLKTATDEVEVDWSGSSINGALTKGPTLMISEGPTQDFAIDFGIRAQIPIARAAGERLSVDCGG